MDPWSKVDYSRHIREASMAMEKLPEVNPPSGRVPGQRLLAAPILKQWRRRNREDIKKKGSLSRVSVTGAKYRRKGAARGAPGVQAPPGRIPTLGCATRAPGALLGPIWPPFDVFGSFWCADFYIIFWEFIGHFKYRENLKYKNSRKQELALGCSELIG